MPPGHPYRSDVHLRPLRPGDAHHVREVLDALSADSRFLRFHTPLPHVPPRLVAALAETCPGHRHGILAFVGGRPVAFGQWVRELDDPTLADASLAVADDHQGRGLGTALLGGLAVDAARHRVAAFSCWVHPANRAVHRMLRRYPTRLGPQGPHQRLVAVEHLATPLPARHGDLAAPLAACDARAS